MNPEKVGQFIKEIRKKNNLTQADLASKYNVTYQAVSKWENGKNLPDVLLLRQMSKDFNISVEDILDGQETKKNNKKFILISLIILFMIVSIIVIILLNNNGFNFKTISSMCSEFEVTGSIAYDKNKSSIYISNINHCGNSDENTYETIECDLYENNNNNKIKISSCDINNNIKLDDYLKNIKLNINNYEQSCKNYKNSNLYLEINAKKDNKITKYEIPLTFKDNCN